MDVCLLPGASPVDVDKMNHKEVPAEKEDDIIDEILSFFLGIIWLWFAVVVWKKCLINFI